MNGTLRPRGKDAWELAVSLGSGPNGKRLRRFETVRGTKAQAQARLREMLVALDRGLPLAQGKVTVAEWLQRWLKERIAPNSSVKTTERYTGIVSKHLTPALGHLLLHKVAPVHVQELEDALLAKGMAPKGVGIVHQALSGALRYAARLDMVSRVATAYVSPPKVTRAEMVIPDVDTVRGILAHAQREGHPYFPPIHLLAFTGARRGEVLGLSWREVDLTGGYITILRSLVRTKQGLIFSPTKTERSRRRIEIDAATVDLLRAHKARQAEHRLRVGQSYDGKADLVFADALGRPVNPQAVTLALQDLARAEGAGHLKLHALRHFHASMVIAQDGLFLASRRLGHANTNITSSVYGHLLDGAGRQVADSFARAMQGR